jgi:hypothetical protein
MTFLANHSLCGLCHPGTAGVRELRQSARFDDDSGGFVA